ncbi:MAG: teichuronic acid biosynthesis glycosyltransferase TuaG [Candidatus Sumerlaeota bacterium]|nr:teichuronic acid biosynthesis glycosyltransferase TuaG [Candidatus Sumerlaeota bacterium]
MTPSSPLVSVIIPAYNAAGTIGETLASLQGQRFARWEAIVADDGSSDATPSLVSAHAARDPRIRLVRLPANTGLPACARNAALAVARGKWIAFLDADDLWESEKLSLQLAHLRRTGARWAFSNSRFFGGGDAHPDGLKYARSYRPPHPFFPSLLTGDGVPFLTVIAARNLLEQVAPGGRLGRVFDEAPALKAVEDSDLTLRLAGLAEPAYVPRPLARYRAHAGGISKRADANYAARVALIRKHQRLGAPARLCRRAFRLQRSKYGIDLLFAGRPGWRRHLLASTLGVPCTGRDIFLAALGCFPAESARWLYHWVLAARRRL